MVLNFLITQPYYRRNVWIVTNHGSGLNSAWSAKSPEDVISKLLFLLGAGVKIDKTTSLDTFYTKFNN